MIMLRIILKLVQVLTWEERLVIGGTDNNVEEYQTNENVQDDEMLAIEANENVEEEDVIGPESCILQNDIAKNFFDLMKDDVPLYPD